MVDHETCRRDAAPLPWTTFRGFRFMDISVSVQEGSRTRKRIVCDYTLAPMAYLDVLSVQVTIGPSMPKVRA